MPGRTRSSSRVNTDPLRQWFVLALLILLVTGVSLGCGLRDSRSSLSSGVDLTLRPNSDVARLLKNAHYYKLMGRPEMALREMEQAYRASPQNYQLANALAGLYEEVGKFEQAQQIYKEVLALDSGNGALANNLCFSYYLAGNLNQAESCFRRTLERQPDNLAARNNLGMILCRQGRQEEARSLWQGAAGPAVAAQKIEQVTAFLGQSVPSRPVVQIHPALAGQEAAPQDPPGRTVTLAVRPPAAAPSPAVPQSAPVPNRQPRPGPGESVSSLLASAPSPPPADHRPLAPAKAAPAVPEAPEAKAAVTAAAQVQEQRPPAAAPPTAVAPQPAAPGAAQASSGAALNRPVPLTAQELEETAIEVRNGNGARDLARETRSILDLEGFNVVSIANHIDFGVDKTTIYYRPGAEKVAQALGHKFFRGAALVARAEMPPNLDVKILLGQDLLNRGPLTAQNAATQRPM